MAYRRPEAGLGNRGRGGAATDRRVLPRRHRTARRAHGPADDLSPRQRDPRPHAALRGPHRPRGPRTGNARTREADLGGRRTRRPATSSAARCERLGDGRRRQRVRGRLGRGRVAGSGRRSDDGLGNLRRSLDLGGGRTLTGGRKRPPFAAFLLVLLGLTGLTVLWQLRDREATADAGALESSSAAPGSSSPQVSPAQAGDNVYAGIAAGNFSSAVKGDPELVYVPNGRPGTVEVIDPRTFIIVRRFHVGSFP